ncbi:MAG: hypothetical protein JRC86_00560 [Deltaproteobacteria bacterium]|nr:hypothetical protein [Deltaproteobacteria bacterium]
MFWHIRALSREDSQSVGRCCPPVTGGVRLRADPRFYRRWQCTGSPEYQSQGHIVSLLREDVTVVIGGHGDHASVPRLIDVGPNFEGIVLCPEIVLVLGFSFVTHRVSHVLSLSQVVGLSPPRLATIIPRPA